MTQPVEPNESKKDAERGYRIFKGRRLGPLAGPWLSSIIIAGIVYYFERTIPALREVTALIYWVLVTMVFIATARWLRVRSSDRRSSERRGRM